MNPEELWFNTPDSHTLCRAGGNGPNHPSQLYAIDKYVKPGMTFLDYGAGSGTTYEALLNRDEPMVKYTGLDIIPKNVDWCNQHFNTDVFKWNKSIHKIDQPDQSFDVVYSRHVVDHMANFEDAMDEHLRVAKKLVIVVLWVPFATASEHEIKNIVDHRGTPEEMTYTNEFTNSYSKEKVMEYLAKKQQQGWKLLELTEGVGAEVKGHDTVICLQRS